MAKITQDMKDIVEKSKPFIVATATKEGKPNGVPVGLIKVVSDDEIMAVNVMMNKTVKNIAENPLVAVTAWNLDVHYGYQFKGKARVETSGKLFDMAVELVNSRPGDLKRTAKAAIIIKVEEVYYIGRDKDTGINLFK
jgi:predicted pyridoxine 5'-phosphate oxidase superfamily flavin-nucleotide-binding protein